MKSKKMNFIEKIINFLLNVLIFIFGVILLISIYTGVQTKILGNRYTNFFGYSIFEVQTGSMEDAINAGDWIIVKLTPKVKLNDIVTYEVDGEYITHRIIEVYNGTYVTKGDANNAKDKPVDQSQIVGKVVNILGSFGLLRKTLFNPAVLITLIITLFLFNFAFKKNKGTKSSKDEGKFLFLGNIIEKAEEFLEKVIKNIKLFWKKIKSNRKATEIFNSSSNIVKKTKLLFTNIHNKIKKQLKELKESRNNKTIESTPAAPKVISKNIERTEKVYDFSKFDDDDSDDDDLEKTSVFRVVSVDSNEVDDKYKEVIPEVEEEEEYEEDDLEKTSVFRIISVDSSEVNDTLLEVAKNEIKDAEQNDKEKNINLEKDNNLEEMIVDEEDDNLTKINLEFLKNKKGNKKGKNIIDIAMFIKKEELNELINILVEDNKHHINKATIKEKFINAYIDAKYYNYYGDRDLEYTGRSLILKIKEVIENASLELISSYKGKNPKFNDTVEIYSKIFILIANLDKAKDSITDFKAKNEFYKKELTKFFKDWDNQKFESVISGIKKIQKNYNDMLEYFLKGLNTNTFDLNLNQLATKKKIYGLELSHNLSFSKVYSDYIIDKTYTEGIIAEDKTTVLLTLLLAKIVEDMITANFNNKYILYIPNSLYTKEKKLDKLLKMIDDKYAKDNIIILIAFEELLNNKSIIKNLRKVGYKFALVFNQEVVIKERNRGSVYIADYIFMNKKATNLEKILSFIPEELLDSIIYEDIVNKVGDFGGE